jgi:hypothetical protein
LRQALADANDGDTIAFAVTGIITLTSGELLVDKSINISGPGADNLAVDGNAKSRVLHITAGRTVTISALTLRNGRAFGFYPGNEGGGILNERGTLMINNCTISENTAENQGGGICNDGSFGGSASLEISDSVVSSNVAEFGGGLCNDARAKGTATLNVSNSTITDNSAGHGGGAAFNVGDSLETAPLRLNSCTVSSNSTQVWGGGIYNHGMVTITNSTVSGNFVSGGGGAVYNELSILSANSTFSDNSASSGGGIYNSSGGLPPSALEISNSILNAGASGENIHNGGTVTSLGYNVSSDDAGGYLNGPGDQINTDPLLGPLQGNGGSTLTHALLPGSPAIEAGDPNFTPPPFYDQRGAGFDRVVNGRLDIGSFEVQGLTPTPTPTPSPTATPTPAATPRPIPTPRPRPSPQPRPTLSR